MAEVMKFVDFKENEGNEAACKQAGKYRQQVNHLFDFVLSSWGIIRYNARQ